MTMTDTTSKVIPIRPGLVHSPPNKGLEEIRQILRDSDVAPAGDELSDAAVISDETKFRRRFGRSFDWGRRDREALIRFKHQQDLTDRQIRLFWCTDNLRRTAQGFSLAASPWIALWACFQLLYVGTLLATVFLGGWENLFFAPLRFLPAWLMLFGLVFFSTALYWSQIKPWLVQRQLQTSMGWT
ncbi:MAG: hypothetical protein JSR75_22575 [Proteobacteria bacterium]|nr:hypothetical protein [Pseudomonadota bacterium]